VVGGKNNKYSRWRKVMTQKNELRELIMFLAHRARNWRRISLFHKRQGNNRSWASWNYEKYVETMAILRHVISLYLPVKHDGMQEFTCCECGRKAWSKTWMLPDVFRRLDIVCKHCTGTGETESYFHRREEK
jgi:hypothetical protein